MTAVISRPLFASSRAAGVEASLDPLELGFASGLALLSRFRTLMQEDAQTVDTQRMLNDSRYAFEQLALAHTSTYTELRLCVLKVFALYQQ
ncbi:MAG: hypothetical protein HC765_16365 [Brachymonas sp.]|nr:hypothetical protein [Brachymonas sp.]